MNGNFQEQIDGLKKEQETQHTEQIVQHNEQVVQHNEQTEQAKQTSILQLETNVVLIIASFAFGFLTSFILYLFASWSGWWGLNCFFGFPC